MTKNLRSLWHLNRLDEALCICRSLRPAGEQQVRKETLRVKVCWDVWGYHCYANAFSRMILISKDFAILPGAVEIGRAHGEASNLP